MRVCSLLYTYIVSWLGDIKHVSSPHGNRSPYASILSVTTLDNVIVVPTKTSCVGSLYTHRQHRKTTRRGQYLNQCPFHLHDLSLFMRTCHQAETPRLESIAMIYGDLSGGWTSASTQGLSSWTPVYLSPTRFH